MAIDPDLGATQLIREKPDWIPVPRLHEDRLRGVD